MAEGGFFLFWSVEIVVGSVASAGPGARERSAAGIEITHGVQSLVCACSFACLRFCLYVCAAVSVFVAACACVCVCVCARARVRKPPLSLSFVSPSTRPCRATCSTVSAGLVLATSLSGQRRTWRSTTFVKLLYQRWRFLKSR